MIYIAVVSAYVLLLFAISVYKRRSVRSDDDFIVAGRSVSVYLLVALAASRGRSLSFSANLYFLSSTRNSGCFV
jgi:Na+/proline symporter